MTDNFADKAEYYVNTLKWYVFPQSKSKAPLIAGGCHSASKDPEVIREWGRIYPDANVAVATGKKSKLVVVDIDGEKGEQSWGVIVKKYLFTEPNCPVVLTSRGRHLYFSGGGLKNSAGVLGHGLDIRCEGGSITAPPSVHASGVVYEWVDRPDAVHPPVFPPVLARILNEREVEWKQRFLNKKFDSPPDLQRLAQMVTSASMGQRNATLNRAAFLASKAIQAGAVTESEVMAILTQAAIQAGLLRHEIRGTIMSGLKGGTRKL